MKFKLWTAFILIVLLAGAVAFGWWHYFGRWQPKTITRHQAEISAALEKAGWVSTHLNGPKLYQIGFRTCPECAAYRASEYPKLHKAGVETRMIMFARPDTNGLAQSTPAERATVAELWVNRNWGLLERWDAVPPEAWTAAGIAPADGDAGRTAVVDAGRKLVDDLTPWLRDNRVVGRELCYPVLIWWDKQGRMRASACGAKQTYRYIRKDLGA
jgi:hypothetical protein